MDYRSVMAKVIPVRVPGVSAAKRPIIPTDAMQVGVHSALRSGSQHKKLVSGVLHLKRESVGRGQKGSSYATGKKAAFRG